MKEHNRMCILALQILAANTTRQTHTTFEYDEQCFTARTGSDSGTGQCELKIKHNANHEMA